MSKFKLQRITFDGNNIPVTTNLRDADSSEDAYSIMEDDMFDDGLTVSSKRITHIDSKTLRFNLGRHDRFYLVKGEDLTDFYKP